jgi:hypothetical protein
MVLGRYEGYLWVYSIIRSGNLYFLVCIQAWKGQLVCFDFEGALRRLAVELHMAENRAVKGVPK